MSWEGVETGRNKGVRIDKHALLTRMETAAGK